METNKLQIKIPKHGWINELAKECGCERHLVTRALYQKITGKKAEKVRELYRQKYQ